MTTEEMVSVVLDVIDANVEAAPADLPDAEIVNWVDREGWPIYHVHGDDPDVVNVFAGGTWLFGCSRVEYRKVLETVRERLA